MVGWLRLSAMLCLLLPVGLPAEAAPTASAPCREHVFENLRFTVCTVDLRQHELRMYWKDEQDRPYGTFQRLPPEAGGGRLLLAMNAGMYLPDLTPAGLYVEEGEELRPANTADGPGNFHMKPNGVFFVDGERAGVLETGQYLERHPEPQFATQSGPMLVIDGRIHPRFLPDSNSRKRRNGVCAPGDGRVTLVITEQPVTFHAFARLFRDELDCDNALYLDGSMSSLYVPALQRRDFLRPMGPIIAVVTVPDASLRGD